jgi:hypothetical protein
MTVRELRDALIGIPNNTKVVVVELGGIYKYASSAEVETLACDKYKRLSEYVSDDQNNIQVVVIGV